MVESSYRLAVDLGTTYTAAAVESGGTVSMVALGNRALQVPSVLFLNADGEFLVGEAAERRGAAEPDRVVREFKRRIGDHVPILVAGTPYSPQALTARLLRWVVDATTEQLGGPPASVVLTHPANWGAYRLDLLRQAGQLADLDDVHTCPEPQAAAAQYAARNRVEPGQRIAVYDLGGGTFDLCVLQQTPDGFQLLGTPEGIEQLGGIDFDEALFQQVTTVFGAHLFDLDPEDSSVMVGLARLRRDCVEAKEALSTDVDTVIPISIPGLTTSVRVTRAEFESLIRPSLRDTITATRRSLRSAGLEAADLSAIVLVGGSSRIPLVAEVLQREFGVPTALDTHPKHDVAMGALLAELDVVPTPLRPQPEPTSEPEIETAIRPLSEAEPAAEPAAVGGQDWIRTPKEPKVVEPSRRWRWRPAPLLVGIVAAVVAAALVLTGILTAWSNRSEAEPRVVGPSPTSTVSSSAGPISSPSTDSPKPSPSAPKPSKAKTSKAKPTSSVPIGANGKPLPASQPLTATELIVPMQVNGRSDLYLADTRKDAPVKRLTHDTYVDTDVVISANRRTFLYVTGPNDHLSVYRAAAATTGDKDSVTEFGAGSQCTGGLLRAAWDPVDPSVVALPCRAADGSYKLYLIRINGTFIRAIPIGAGNRADDPSFSPDGKQLVYWVAPAKQGAGGGLYVASLTGKTKIRQLTGIHNLDADPAWSPNGKTIAFRRIVDNNADIYTIAANGSAPPVRIIHTIGNDQDPSWSPSGKQIAYKTNAPTSSYPGKPVQRVWIANADGSHQRLLWTKDAPGAQGSPAWSVR